MEQKGNQLLTEMGWNALIGGGIWFFCTNSACHMSADKKHQTNSFNSAACSPTGILLISCVKFPKMLECLFRDSRVSVNMHKVQTV